MDYDEPGGRNLTIRCNGSTHNAVNWHFYVRRGLGGFRYLGQTFSGTDATLNWAAGESNRIIPEFRNGPDFNSVYTFRAVRLDGQLGPDDFYTAEAPMGFNLSGGNALALANPDGPNLPAGEAAVYDDITGGTNLAPMGGAGEDTDRPAWRALQIAWNFGADPSTVNDYHVYVSVDGQEHQYLGQTGSGGINYFWWASIAEYKMNPEYANGPEDGRRYTFRVFLERLSKQCSN